MIYVMSDIHGQYSKFLEMLKRIDFNELDVLYILGDIIDRGPKNLEMIQYVMSHKNIKMLLGNHEDMFLKAMKNRNSYDEALWYQNGGYTTDKQIQNISNKELKDIKLFFENLPLEIFLTVNDKNFWLVHGNYVTEKEKKKFSKSKYRETLIWGRIKVEDEGPNDKIVLFGHTPTYKYYGKENPLKIWKNKNVIGLDCGMAAYYKNNDIYRLACLRLDDMAEFYV